MAFSGIKAPKTIPRVVGLIAPLGISGIFSFEIVLGASVETPILSDNSSITLVILSETLANSKNLVLS